MEKISEKAFQELIAAAYDLDGYGFDYINYQHFCAFIRQKGVILDFNFPEAWNEETACEVDYDWEDQDVWNAVLAGHEGFLLGEIIGINHESMHAYYAFKFDSASALDAFAASDFYVLRDNVLLFNLSENKLFALDHHWVVAYADLTPIRRVNGVH